MKHLLGPKFFIGKHNYLIIVFVNDNSKYGFPHYLKKNLVENFLSLEYHFLKNSYPLKIFIKIFSCRKFFIIGKSFPRE